MRSQAELGNEDLTQILTNSVVGPNEPHSAVAGAIRLVPTLRGTVRFQRFSPLEFDSEGVPFSPLRPFFGACG